MFLIRGDGHVGIGTASPKAKLDIQGGANSDGTDDPKAIALSWMGGGFSHWIRTRHNAAGISGNAIDFFTNTSTSASGSSAPGTGNQLVMSLNGGNVGVGIENPNAKLQDTRGDVFVNTVGTGLILKSSNGSCFRVTVGNVGVLGTSSVLCT